MTRLLVLAETDGGKILPATLPTIAFAQQFAQADSSGFDLLVIGGPEIASGVETVSGYGEERVFVAAAAELLHPTADDVAAVCVQVMRQAGTMILAGPSSAFGRDVLPRIAGLLDAPMVSDVLSVAKENGRLLFRRPMFAGNFVAAVQVEGEAAVFSVRGTAFGAPQRSAALSSLENVHVSGHALPQGTEWIGLDAPEQKRPELTNARVVVSGGRPVGSAENFETLLGGLADKLGGAIGATRAAVDSGMAPNEWQVGQTGKIVAPELYIAAGVSGSIQHLAGMKDSKTIVAINTDGDAPIFGVADYGLVGDLHQILPELTAKL